ncbi:hypothetical protein EJ110_NYTH35441 [Nymphaea thermarum]|nr:hypothetical protein EJ110_NYTH35441 [Nymphaea thermarum]
MLKSKLWVSAIVDLNPLLSEIRGESNATSEVTMAHSLTLQSVGRGARTGVQQLTTGGPACSFAGNAVPCAYVFLPAPTATGNTAHAITIGRTRPAAPNAPECVFSL